MSSVLLGLPLIIQLLAFPLLWVAIDCFAACRSSRTGIPALSPTTHVTDFTMLVPIYGSVDYLRNVDWLRNYDEHVWLLTTTSETAEFTDDLDALAAQHGFRVFATDVPGRRTGGRRATSGAMRDTLVRDALEHVRSRYVVCIDADTTTIRPLDELISIMHGRGLDFVSVRLVPSNTNRWLGKLQTYEYRVAMRLRVLMPWLVSGACHAARTDVHRDIMRRHSLFFQGNDVETGILAARLGYRVGHIPFEVRTDVPESPRSWFRQRLAWAGEFRLFAINAHLIRRHVWLWIYGLLLVLVALPLRWLSITGLTWSLLITYALYLVVSLYIHKGKIDRYVIILPIYAAFSSLVMAPLGIIWYFVMAIRDRNMGIVRVNQTKTAIGP